MNHAPRNKSFAGYGFLTMLVALLLFIVVPIALVSVLHVPIPGVSLAVSIIAGVIFILVGAGVVTYANLYHIASASRAFVRMGTGGERVVIDGGALVVPTFHTKTDVTLAQIRIDVMRHGNDALLTKDFLRADTEASFFVYVPKDPEKVLQAARSLSAETNYVDQQVVAKAVQEKFVSALRSVAATMDIQDLVSDRQQFQEAVKNHVASEIVSNGLVLDTVTVSKLDQTNYDNVNSESNIFDAQGQRRAAQTIAEQNVQRNNIQLQAQLAIESKNVETSQALAQQQIIRSTAEAERDRQIQIVRATATQESMTAAAEQERLASLANLTRDRDIAVATVQREQAEEVAEQARQRAIEVAQIERQQTVEVAGRNSQIAIAERETARASAEADRLSAEANRQTEFERIKTVEVTQQAERQRATTVIDAEASAKKRQVDQETLAQVEAFKVVTQAQAEQKAAALRAEAIKIDAEAQANSISIRAQADANAAQLRSTGEQAIQLVPVTVERERVNVASAEVDVLGRRLEVQTANEQVAIGLQVELAKIEADKQVRIASAQAMGQALANANLTIWGDQNALAQMTERFYQGQSVANAINGFDSAATGGLASAVGSALTSVAGAAAKKLESASNTNTTGSVS